MFVIDLVVDGVVFVEDSFGRLSMREAVVVVAVAMVVVVDAVVVATDRGPGIGGCDVGGVEGVWGGVEVVFVVKGGNSFNNA